MDSLEGDLGVPSFDRPPRRASTLPAVTCSTLNPTPTRAPPPPSPLRSTELGGARDLTRRLSFPDTALDDETLSNLRRWIIGFVLVDFDIDTGPNLDNNYPHLNLPPSIRHQLAFSSLPEGDLTLSQHGYYSYSWRIPYPADLGLPPTTEGQEYDAGLYGYVWFSQEQNSSLRRNYSQRSLVLLTHHPHLPGLFSSVLEVLGPLHFLHAKQSGAKGGMVESACLNIAAWPEPTAGATLELPLLGTVLNVTLPLPYQAQYPTSHLSVPPSLSLPPASITTGPPPTLSILTSTTLPPRILPATHPLTPLSLLFFSPQSPLDSTTGGGGQTIPSQVGFTKLLLIWELLILNEPLLIYTNDPKTGSELVGHLRNLVRPVPLVPTEEGLVKPYFHIHDPTFQTLCRPGTKPRSGLLISSTNPLVFKNCQKTYPHILRLDRTPNNLATSLTTTTNLSPSTREGNENGNATLPSISPLIGRKKAMFDQEDARSTSTSSSSRSSSLVSTNRNRATVGMGGGGGDYDATSSSRSSSPVSSIHRAASMHANKTATTTTNSNGGGGGGGKSDGSSWWGLKSERKRHVKKDEQVWKLVEQKWRAKDYVGCDEVIYRHFASLTEKLLSPLSRYLLTAPVPAPTSSNDFLASLKTHGTPLSLRSSNSFSVSFSQPGTNATERFYARFWDTKGCEAWRASREREMRKALADK